MLHTGIQREFLPRELGFGSGMKYRRLVRAKNIKPRIARRGDEHGSGPGTVRCVIEPTLA
jgi:hypothetical protein